MLQTTVLCCSRELYRVADDCIVLQVMIVLCCSRQQFCVAVLCCRRLCCVALENCIVLQAIVLCCRWWLSCVAVDNNFVLRYIVLCYTWWLYCAAEYWTVFQLMIVQPIADRVAQHLEIISKNFWFSTRRTRILMGFIIYYLVLIVNPMAEFWLVGKVLEIISKCCAILCAIGCTVLQ